MKPLYGCDSCIQLIYEELKSGNPPVSFMCGITGIGKSAIAEGVSTRLVDSGFNVTYYSVEGDIQAYEEPFIRHLRNLVLGLEKSPLKLSDVINVVSKNPENKLAKLISGIYQDLATKVGLDKTINALGGIFEESVDQLVDDAKKLADEDKNSFYSNYVDTLRLISPSLQSRNILIIDHVESASEELWRFLKAFSKNKPSGVGLLLIVNNEQHNGVTFIRETMPTLQYLGVEPKIISGLTIDALREWVYEKKGIVLPDEILSKALKSLEGRPEDLKTWIVNNDLSLETLEEPIRRTYGFYNEIYDKLSSDHARACVRLLGNFSSGLTLDVSLVFKMIGVDESSIHQIVDELENCGFIIRQDREVKLCHGRIGNFIKETKLPLSPVEVGNIINVLEDHYGPIDAKRGESSLVDTKKGLLMISTSGREIEFITSVAERQFSEGAYRSALSTVNDVIRMTADCPPKSNIELKLIAAKANEQLGFYSDGIKQLSEWDRSDLLPEDAFRICILLGKLFFRLNNYDRAIPLIDEAESLAERLKNADFHAKALIYKSHIFRDIEQYDAAYDIAEVLKGQLMEEVEGRLIRAHIHRSVSRSMSSRNMAEAIEEANISIDIAVNEYSRGDQGNGYFTLGEAYRLNKQYADSVKAYVEGLEIAMSLENKDLEIYCCLGLAASFIVIGKLEKAASYLERLRILKADKFPVETLHSNLLNYVCVFIENGEFSSTDSNRISKEYAEKYYRIGPQKFLEEFNNYSSTDDRKTYVHDNPIRF